MHKHLFALSLLALAGCAAEPAKPPSTAVVYAPRAAAAPAAPPAAPVVVKSPEADQVFRSTGFRIEMHGNDKMYCRDDKQTGSRIATRHTCLTEVQFASWKEDAARNAQRAVDQVRGSTAASGGH